MLGSEVRPLVHDPEFPAAARLLEGGAPEVVSTALAQEGGTLQSLASDFVLYTPNQGMTVLYGARVGWSDATVTDEKLVVFARRDRRPPAEVRTADLAGTTLGIWRFPEDPYLPGLRSAADPQFVTGLLRQLGFPRGTVSLQLRAYRPGLRAVIEVTLATPGLLLRRGADQLQPATHHRSVFLKVLRAGEAGALAAMHEALAELLPAPHCLHHDDDLALVVLEAMPGHSMWESLAQQPPFPPAPLDLVEALDRLASVRTQGPIRTSIYDAVTSHAHLLRALAPEESGRIDRLATELRPRGEQPLITVHGDFYDAQVLVKDGRVVGLLDLDDVGPGERADDLATMAGRIWTIAETQSDPVRRAEITEYALKMLEAFSSIVDPGELDRRVAGILLGRATGPFRAQQSDWPEECVRRIRAAEAWLEQPRVPGMS
jgi:aminoglycoside phosphotransferase